MLLEGGGCPFEAGRSDYIGNMRGVSEIWKCFFLYLGAGSMSVLVCENLSTYVPLFVCIL